MLALDKNPAAIPPLLSIFILSAAALAYEVLLIRLFSIVHWHHFAFMVISMALLGYGASGSFITVLRSRLLHNYDFVFITSTVLFGVSSIVCFIVVQQLPFNALEILWDSSQWQRLLLTYLLLTLPFFFVANAIALSMMAYHRKIALIYAVDLIGAGIGALSVMLLLQYFPAVTLLSVIALAGITASLFALPGTGYRQKRAVAALLMLCMLAVLLIPQKWLTLHMSEYKGLAQTLLIKDTALRLSHSSPIARTDVVQSPLVPWSYFASNFYHNVYWYPFVGRHRVEEALKTRWGQHFQQYGDGEVVMPGMEKKTVIQAVAGLTILTALVGGLYWLIKDKKKTAAK